VKELVSALVQERQDAEEDEEAVEASEDDNSELDFDATLSTASKQKKKPPSSSEETFKWNLSPALMTFLDVQVSEMPFREVG